MTNDRAGVTKESGLSATPELDALDAQEDAEANAASWQAGGPSAQVEVIVDELIAGATQSYHELSTKSPLFGT
ncbi:MAG: hypothetical protein H0X37_03265 [Herpetosiphonaceae bacterium]|nr:hypothetical protein [Herpetosiphonaceae bacterium]